MATGVAVSGSGVGFASTRGMAESRQQILWLVAEFPDMVSRGLGGMSEVGLRSCRRQDLSWRWWCYTAMDEETIEFLRYRIV